MKNIQQELSELKSIIKLLGDSKDNSQSKEYFLNKLVIENDYRNTFQTYFELNENAKYNLYKIQNDIIKVTKEIKKYEEGKNNIQEDFTYGKRLSDTPKNIARISKELKKLEKEKVNFQGIQIVQLLVTTELPKTNKIKRNVILSSVVGLFLMFFLSFFLEYLNKHKRMNE